MDAGAGAGSGWQCLRRRRRRCIRVLLLRPARHPQERLRHRHPHRLLQARDDMLTPFRSLVVGAQRWHPDQWASNPGEAKRRFQWIQEAYSVLSDKGKKKAMHDAGLFDPLDDDDKVKQRKLCALSLRWEKGGS